MMEIKTALFTTLLSQYLEPSELEMLMTHSNIVSFNTGYLISVIVTNLLQFMHISNIYLNFLSLFYPETKYKILLAITHQIFDRIKNTHNYIISILEKADMTKQPFLGRVITSLIKPSSIS